jgi:hypothetical protein
MNERNDPINVSGRKKGLRGRGTYKCWGIKELTVERIRIGHLGTYIVRNFCIEFKVNFSNSISDFKSEKNEFFLLLWLKPNLIVFK